MSDKLKNYAKVIAAFAEGKPIEACSRCTGLWHTFESENKAPPTYSCWEDFRIARPKLRYRVALLSGSSGNYLTTVYGDSDASYVETSPSFIRWVRDWEYADSSS